MKPRLATLKPRLKVLDTQRAIRLPPTYSPSQKPSQQPGYRIRGRRGQQIRAAHLRANPLCAACLAMTPPRITPAQEVDHILALANGGSDTPENKQSLCTEHHRLKTEADLKAAR